MSDRKSEPQEEEKAMRWNPDDPRLTAYALGELDSPDREAMEALVNENPEARRIVEEIRAAAERLAAELTGEPVPGLTPEQKERIAAAAPSGARSPGGIISIFRITAVAAGLLFMVGVGVLALLGEFDSSAGPKVDREVAGYELSGDYDVEVAQGAARRAMAAKLPEKDDEGSVRYRPHRSSEGFRGMRGTEPNKMFDQHFDEAVTKYKDVVERKSPDLPRSGDGKPALLNLKRDGTKAGRLTAYALARDSRGDKPGEAGGYRGPAGQVPPNLQPAGTPAPPPNPTTAPAPDPTLVAGARFYAGRVKAEDARRPDDEQGRRARPTFVPGREPHNTETYDRIVENPFKNPRNREDALSTFSIDVDTASYAIVRRYLKHNTLPPPGAVKIEEFVNYFNYHYAEPIDEHPFSAHVEVAGCPWRTENRLVRIGLKGKTIHREDRPATNLVFLLDVSGSMAPGNKLPLVRQAMKELVAELDERDRVGIVTYAGTSGLALRSTPCNEKATILGSIDRLRASGSTNGGAGIAEAYQLAVENFIDGGANRVILCTDGDFNVGVTNRSELVRLIQDRARTGVFLSVLGFGMGNLKNATLEDLADKGNGHYAYIDDIAEARKMLVEGLTGTLITIAKDVKIQVEFNPGKVAAYRLLGYENRVLAHRDFNDDRKDAGEIGAGHTVTALYEVVPAGGKVPGPAVDPLKYQSTAKITSAADSNEMLTVKLRYKQPDGDKSTLMEVPAVDHGATYGEASRDFKFAAAVASFAMVLRGSEYRGTATFDQILELGAEGQGADPKGRRAEFLELVRKAKSLVK